MPIEYSTSLDLDLVYARWHGHVDLGQFRDMFSGFLRDAHYRPGRTELIDLTEISTLDADFSRVWSVLRTVNQQSPGTVVRTRTVILAPSDVAFGLSRIYQSLADNAGGVTVEVFRTEADAIAALDVPYATISELCAKGNFLPASPGDDAQEGMV